MRRLMIFFLAVCFFGREASAQTFDVRAYSRQRGFKAYAAQPYVSPSKPEIRKRQPEKKNNPVENAVVAQQNEDKKFQQTGIKIFQKKDEARVMNFDVENPEFDKLSPQRQQDLMTRITFKNSAD